MFSLNQKGYHRKVSQNRRLYENFVVFYVGGNWLKDSSLFVLLHLFGYILEVLFHYSIYVVLINIYVNRATGVSNHLVNNTAYSTFIYVCTFTINIHCGMKIALYINKIFLFRAFLNITYYVSVYISP